MTIDTKRKARSHGAMNDTQKLYAIGKVAAVVGISPTEIRRHIEDELLQCMEVVGTGSQITRGISPQHLRNWAKWMELQGCVIRRAKSFPTTGYFRLIQRPPREQQ